MPRSFCRLLAFDPCGLRNRRARSACFTIDPSMPFLRATNWRVATKAGRKFFLIFRFYGPKPAAFDGSWELNDIELVKWQRAGGTIRDLLMRRSTTSVTSSLEIECSSLVLIRKSNRALVFSKAESGGVRCVRNTCPIGIDDVYTDSAKITHIIRRVELHRKSWLNYIIP